MFQNHLHALFSNYRIVQQSSIFGARVPKVLISFNTKVKNADDVSY